MPKLRKLVKLYREQRVPSVPRKILFRTIPGEKHKEDRILQLRTNGQFVNITFHDLLVILDHFFKNEDIIYGHVQGRSYLFNAIRELYGGKSIEEVYKKYRHKKLEL